MSNIYLTEPPTQGKVLLHTSGGDIDIELWSKEAPLACRNFIQLSLEGYYDNTPVHRVIKDFMVQAGDPTGTGTGGDSIWGKPFKDEIHGRIKFNHRGQVAMANENRPNTNRSQFFITLGPCEWINRKHTIFGKVTGNTVFNLLKLGEVETGPDDKPVDPITIESVEVLWNPFDDIEPRAKVANKKQESTRVDPVAERKKNRKGAKDKKLLSFGEEEEADDISVPKKKMMSAHDIPQDTLSAEVDEELLSIARMEEERRKEKKHQQKESDIPVESKQCIAKTAIPQGSAEDEEEDFELRMLNKIRQQRLKSKNKPMSSTSSTLKATRPPPSDDGSDKELDLYEHEKQSRNEGRDKEADERSKEFSRIKREMLQSRRAVKVLTGEEAKQRRDDTAYHELVTPLEQRRQRYIKRKKDHGNRQEETLARLQEFTNKLKKVKKETPAAESTGKNKSQGIYSEAYTGQVLDNENDDEAAGNSADWHTGKLKFRKHIDDAYRMGGDGRSLDDYKVEDAAKRGSHMPSFRS